MKTVYLMCGIPGSGKSTWLKEHCDVKRDVIISRDAIRFSLLEPGDQYFSKEKEVWKQFISTIREYINSDFQIYVDATHLNKASRSKLINAIAVDGIKYVPIVFDVPLEVAIARDAKRKGRAHVGADVITNMYNSFEKPTIEEFEEIIEITRRNIE